MEQEQHINAYVCQYCKGSFDKLENLNKHVQQIHTVRSSGKENRICPLCGTQCIKIEGYRNHLRHIHGHNEEGQVVVFKSFNDFLVWKNELEKRNYCKYVMRVPPKKLPSNDKIHIYQCDSSVGSMKEKKSGVAARDSCPAVISAIESAKTKGVKIEHWNTHVGHVIPIGEDELDAAIGSLGTTEIVLTSDQRYQCDGQNVDGNIFFIESNDGSLSEAFVKELPKKSNLFQNVKTKVSDNIPKVSTQKFSYKKDPTRKSGSFNYSLASVACMKPSAKKKVVNPPAYTPPSTVADSGPTTTTNSEVMLTTPSSSVTYSEVELASEILSAENLSQPDTPVKSKEKETPVPLASPSKKTSNTNSGTIANQTFEIISDDFLSGSGQVVLLNSLPGQNSNQNVVLSNDQKFISIGPPISVETVSSKKGKGSKKSQKSIKSPQIVMIPTTPEKENVSTVQNVLDLVQNPISLDGLGRSPGPSILKKAKKSFQKSPKKSELPKGKKITFSVKNAAPSAQNSISLEQKLCLGLNPSLDVSVVKAVPTTSSSISTDSVKKNKLVSSTPLKVTNSASKATTKNSSSVSIMKVTASTSSSISSNPVSSTANISVSGVTSSSVSSIANNAVSSVANIYTSSTPNSSAAVIPSVQPVNQILLNSFPPGQTFMSINNNLIPIGTPAPPILPSNFNPGFVLTSPVPPSPVIRPVQPQVNFSPVPSRFASSTRTYDKKTQNKQTNSRTASCLKTMPQTTVPLLLIPNSGSQISHSVPLSSPFIASSANSTLSPSIVANKTQPIISNPLISGSMCSVLPRPLISNTVSPVFTHLSPGTQLISTPIIPTPFLSNNGQQISRPVLQNVSLLTTTGQQISRPLLQNVSFSTPLIGQPAIAPRAIVSTTVSNAIKVQKVQLPFSKSMTTSPSVTLTNTTSLTHSVSESTKVNSVVINTEPISSAPAISIPSVAPFGLHKPGSLIFESQGDVYMLEPVEDNSQISNTVSLKNVHNKVSVAVPSMSDNRTNYKNKSEVGDSTFAVNNSNLSSLQKDKTNESQSSLDSRVGKVKSLSPRKNTDIKNGVQIKSVAQEKRHLKDDDVEILKKVKYYQLEMKYLSSQAECKRLKLELAMAHRKNKENIKNNTDLLSSEISQKENTVEKALHLDLTSDKANLDLKPNCSAGEEVENMAMDVDVCHEVDSETTEDKTTGVEDVGNSEPSNQHDADSGDSNHTDDICADSGDSNCGGNSLADSGDSNNSDSIKSPAKESRAGDGLDNQNNNYDLEDVNCNIESDKGINLETRQDACSLSNKEIENINTLENKSNNSNECDETFETDSNEKLTDINNTILNKSENECEKVEDEFMDTGEIEDIRDAMDYKQTINDSEIVDQNEVQESGDKQPLISNQETSEQSSNLDNKDHAIEYNELNLQKPINGEEEPISLDDQNNSSFHSEQNNLPCDKTQFQGTLKELEFQYGGEETSDIYTMIRTSVLRSLYDDMKTLCEENKKLYEKVQNSRSQEEEL